MALALKDRVKESSVSTGTGTITLDGVTGPYQSFSVIGDGNTTYYAIVGQTTTQWEVGIGTYTASGTTLSRDIILSSSASGAAVNFSAGTKDVFVTYPSEKSVFLDLSDDSNAAATVGTTPVRLGATTATLAGLESVTLTQDPTANLQVTTKQYVDNLVATGIHFHEPVRVESPINLPATYNNGTSGVGATLTNSGTQAALVIDGVTLSVTDRVLIYEQTDQTQNGVYVVTDVGSGSTNWVLTRSSDADTFGLTSANTLGEGSTFFVRQGDIGAGETHTCNTAGTITFGTTNITFAQISSAQIYSAGTGLTLTNTTFSLSNTTVTPATKGTASKTVTATVNAQGQLTSLTDQDIAIQMSQVTSGVLPVTQGGTGFSTYVAGDLITANTSTSLAKLSDVAVGNALISGGVGTGPSYGKIGLTTHVSGTLPVANGGTGVTTSTGSGNNVLSTSPTLVTPVLGTPSSGNLANCTFPTLNQNTTGTASNVTGVVAVANGGTGNTTAQAAINTLAGATTSGQYLRGNGTNVVMANIVAGDVPTLNQNTTGSAATLTTARTIGGVSFNGSANINLPGVNQAGNQNTTGNAATATVLQTARLLNGVSFNGSANITVPTNLGVTAGTTAGPTITSSSGTNVVIPTASATASGVVTTGTQTWAGTKVFQGIQASVNIADGTIPTVIKFGRDGSQYVSMYGNASGNRVISVSTSGNPKDFQIRATDTVSTGTYTFGRNGTLTASTFSGALSGNASTATVLQTARTIGGVSFNGSANINLPGVNQAGNQNTSGNAATATTATNQSGGSVNATTGVFSNLITGRSSTSTDVNTANDTGSISIRGSSSTVAAMSFHRTGAFAINMGVGTDNVFRIGGFSAADNALQLNPDGNLTTAGIIRAGNTGTTNNPMFSMANDTNTGMFFPAADTLALSTAGVERMRLNASGSFLLGKTVVNFRAIGIQTENNSRTFGLTSNISGVMYFASRESVTGNYHSFFFNGSFVGSIATNGSSTSYNTTSDYRLKENIAPMVGALDKVMQLRPVTYTWKLGGSSAQGFIAHELQEVVPDAVTGEKDALDEKGKIKPQGVDASVLVATLTAAIQELSAKVDTLQAELNTLKAQSSK